MMRVAKEYGRLVQAYPANDAEPKIRFEDNPGVLMPANLSDGFRWRASCGVCWGMGNSIRDSISFGGQRWGCRLDLNGCQGLIDRVL